MRGVALALCLLALVGCDRGSVGSEPVSRCVPEGACPEEMFRTGVRADLGDVAAGQRLYEARCVACHGTTGQALPGTAGIDFESPAWHARMRDADIAAVIAQGRPPAMPPQNLTEAQIRDVVAYLRSLKGAGAAPPTPPSERSY